mmetsp:Transcript_131929/g.186185  ORF Transcript_131929/g.186185 Transcript_131929/m.186185 type:complete len:215 (+) Transcript_131929:45-689(+)
MNIAFAEQKAKPLDLPLDEDPEPPMPPTEGTTSESEKIEITLDLDLPSKWISFRSSQSTVASHDASRSCSSRGSTFSDTSLQSLRCAAKRSMRKQRRQAAVEEFLTFHGFKGVNSPKRSLSSMLRQTEEVYPIHIAAKHGSHLMIRLLCSEGADPLQKTSRGRTALQLAREVDMFGSHREVIDLLASNVNVLTFRDFQRDFQPPVSTPRTRTSV